MRASFSRALAYSVVATLTVFAFGCGDETVNVGDGIDAGNNNPRVDAGGGGGGADAAVPPPNCVAGNTECSNCIDDDSDGYIDGFDVECTSALDNDEGSFATDIPGDNKDAVWQDCFFDGNSGAGNDGCNIHVCCLLGAANQAECPADLKPDQYDPTQCTVNADCVNSCAPLTPPGCDCFACCTLCDNDNNCYDVLTNPLVSPGCDLDVLGDPDQCKPCNKVAECSTGCEPSGCILCPGQTEDDLPPECGGNNACPGDQVTCESSSDCQATEFCSNGCCIIQIL